MAVCLVVPALAQKTGDSAEETIFFYPWKRNKGKTGNGVKTDPAKGFFVVFLILRPP